MKRDNIVSEIEERDLVELHQILTSTFNPNTTYEKVQNSYNMQKQMQDTYMLGYYIEDKLVGTITLNILLLPSGREGTIWSLAVNPEYRRLGIATKLMNRAEEIAKGYEDIRTIWLFSGMHRQSAHELYRRLGYDENIDKAFVKQIQK